MIHNTAIVDENVFIGYNTKIWHWTHVSRGSKIGENCTLGQNVYIGPNVKIGNNVKIQNNVSIYTGIICEDNVFFGPSCVLTNDLNPRCAYPKNKQYVKTIIKKGVTIGANATIVCGVTIGQYAMVGAGAVVTKNVPDYTLVLGVPARPVGYVCYCGERLNIDTNEISQTIECHECERTYDYEDEVLTPR